MTYKEATKFLFEQLPMYQRQGKAAYKADLKTTLLLDEYFEYPHKQYKTVHIAGTNGKGSVSHMLASILQQAGYKVGLYTSPHLKDFRERIKIDGKPIPEESVTRFVEEHSSIINKLEPSFFEMTAAMAFDYFRQEKVDVAVIEVGMGGRLDSTNIISPDLSIITNISLDHTTFLGSTKKQIAAEKAGIIKSGTPVVIGESDNETDTVFRDIAEERNAPLINAGVLYQIPFSTFSADEKQIMQVYTNGKVVFHDLKVSLMGWYQKKNIVTALAACKTLAELGYKIDNSSIYKGLEVVQSSTGLLGRWQILDYNPRVICDTGHNEAGIKAVIEQIKNTPYKNLHIVWGMVNDKDTDAILAMLPTEASYYFTKAKIPRSLDEKLLLQKAQKFNLKGNSYINVKVALNKARKLSTPNDLIFIGGSTFIVADIL
jgi:dihydrofolate synthase/folylpolyglutamate synthase